MQEISNQIIVDDIIQWVKYVADTRTSNDWPICPYAQKALVGKRVKIYPYNFLQNDQAVSNFLADSNDFKVWVFICDSAFDVEAEAKVLNTWYEDVVWLWDFANASGEIDGVLTGNQKYNLLLLQDKAELIRMSAAVRERGYYSNWSSDYYNQIVSWRK